MILDLRVHFDVFLGKLETIYGAMDRAYGEAASFYRMDCAGCQDNCCRTYFFHYAIFCKTQEQGFF